VSTQLLATISASILLLGTACKSAPHDRGAAAGKNVTKAAQQIEVGITQLDATVASLKALVENPAAELKTQYKTFSKNLSNLESTAATVRDVSASMQAKGKAYFTEWDKQIAAIQNEDIRERSAERLEKVGKEFEEIGASYAEAKEKFRPLLADLQDIRTALEAELTTGSLDALKDNAEEIADKADSVKETLQELASSFRDLGVKLSSAGPAPAAASAQN
jgi:ABC-type transporter Mla subunit MlaD